MPSTALEAGLVCSAFGNAEGKKSIPHFSASGRPAGFGWFAMFEFLRLKPAGAPGRGARRTVAQLKEGCPCAKFLSTLGARIVDNLPHFRQTHNQSAPN